jgi:uncharacterized protein (DUF1501 family)
MSDIMRRYIIGALFGFILSIGVGAHAEVINMIGKVIDGAFTVKVDGNTLADQAIVVEGTSYLPVRAFGDATGYDIKFNPDLSIEMTKKQVVTSTPTATPATQTGENPLMKPYRELNDKLGKLVEEKQALETKINDIKTHHETENQNTDDLQQQVTDKQAQIDKLVIEKQALEVQMQSQP